MNWMRLPLVAMFAAASSVTGDSVQTPFRIDRFANRTADRATDPHDHSAALALLDASVASHVAVRSGNWSDPGTWSSGVPTAGARVVIPATVTVTVTAHIAVAALDWIRVDGRLHFSAADNSQLSVRTVFVARAGTLSIGEPDRTVDPDKTVRLLFAPRSATVRRQDRFDVLGGLIALGHVYIYGAPKAGFSMPSNPLRPGVSELTFRTLPTGWKVGDELLFPAAAVGSEDEQRHIASISNDGTTISSRHR